MNIKEYEVEIIIRAGKASSRCNLRSYTYPSVVASGTQEILTAINDGIRELAEDRPPTETMTDAAYNQKVREFIDTVLPQCGGLVLDIGLVNELAMECSRRLKGDNP